MPTGPMRIGDQFRSVTRQRDPAMAVVVTDTVGSVPRHELNASVKLVANHKLAACYTKCQAVGWPPPTYPPQLTQPDHFGRPASFSS